MVTTPSFSEKSLENGMLFRPKPEQLAQYNQAYIYLYYAYW